VCQTAFVAPFTWREGASVFGALLVDEASQPARSLAEFASHLQVAALIETGAATASVAGPLVYQMVREALRQPAIGVALERAVTFRCSSVPVPPFLAGTVPTGYGPPL
jgi:hypothetical protein